MLKHIAISITESDLKDFYIEILEGKITRHFVLNQEDASKIFDIDKQVDVYYLELENIEFELFINPVTKNTSFSHLCIEMNSADKVFIHAFEGNYWTHLRNSNERETFFIKDKNGNMSELLPNIKNIILVASGKGGVGKTTVAVNLAVELARQGFRTGLFDADIYGPSVPLNLGIADAKAEVVPEGDKSKITPVVKYGIKVMSLGFLMKKEDAVIWRGPMASKALTQLVEDTEWGELDYLIFDLPPGTGDVAITLSQKLPQAKALIVITPQQVAVADGRKAARMFTTQGVKIPILGIIENMSYFVPEKHPDEKYFLFGQGGGEQLAKEMNCPLLAQVPLVSDVCELSDTGKTIFASSNKIIVEVFQKLAQKIKQENIVLT